MVKMAFCVIVTSGAGLKPTDIFIDDWESFPNGLKRGYVQMSTMQGYSDCSTEFLRRKNID